MQFLGSLYPRSPPRLIWEPIGGAGEGSPIGTGLRIFVCWNRVEADEGECGRAREMFPPGPSDSAIVESPTRTSLQRRQRIRAASTKTLAQAMFGAKMKRHVAQGGHDNPRGVCEAYRCLERNG
eukprot:GHVU01093234.1.p2 GENE.GHVU01093234.1~~GHVU01093234.1.p2  ORF type:complete len:124 (+),score=9.43 GHVU01093234.1:382-753(+)